MVPPAVRADGLAIDDIVTAEQMKHLFGSGCDPITGRPLGAAYKVYGKIISEEQWDNVGYAAHLAYDVELVHERPRQLEQFLAEPRRPLDELLVAARALGAGAVTPLQMASGYSVFANGGYVPVARG